MDISNDLLFAATDLTDRIQTNDRPDESFAFMLDADRLQAEADAARSDVLASQQSKTNDKRNEDIDFIRKHGMRAFVEEMHKQKMEELREKILAAMGLTEEMLAEMPVEARQAINKSINQEIQKRLASESALNDGDATPWRSGSQVNVNDKGAGELLAAQVLASDPGALIGLINNEDDYDPTLLNERKEVDETR